VLLLHAPSAQHRHLEPAALVLLCPQVEVAERHADDVTQGRVLLRVAELHDVCFAGVVDDSLFEPLDLAHLHLDHEPPAGRVGAFDVHNRELQLRHIDVLVAAQMLDIEDAPLTVELEQVVEQGDEQGLARLGAEDPLEDEVGLGSAKTGCMGTFYAGLAREATRWPRDAAGGSGHGDGAPTVRAGIRRSAEGRCSERSITSAHLTGARP
jgi:hypothetical protein